jgi:acyl-coenzyme A thioesterase PaaI-like protein
MDDARSAPLPANSHIDHPQGRRVLANEVRRLVRATRTNAVDQETRGRAVALLLEVDDDKVVHGFVTFTEPYNGPPFDTAHGGIIALVYDDLVGMAAMVGAGGGMTANLSIDYRKPTPMFRRIELTASLERYEGRKFWAHGEMRLDGELLNEANGLFIRPKGLPPLVSTG